jgi:prephenate dehydratase
LTLIAFQGQAGAYSDLACHMAYPGTKMLPPENSIAGRVPDMHALLPESGLSIIGERFLRIEHCLLAPAGASIGSIKRIHSHPVALGQVRNLIAELGAVTVVEYDTAGAAEIVAGLNNIEDAAIASSLAGEIHGLQILRRNVEDAAHNTTRFYVLAREPQRLDPHTPDLMTSFVFNVRNIPAALYKALGGFATNGVNMTKLESYMVNGSFTATQFLSEVDGHPEQPALKRAFEELKFFSTEITILGTYKADPFRLKQRAAGG